jgi:hypothetical protein
MNEIILDSVHEWLIDFQKTFEECIEARDAAALMNAEESIFRAVLKLADTLFGLVLESILEDTDWASAANEEMRERVPGMRSKGFRTTPVRLLGGSVINVQTPYWVPNRQRNAGRRRRVGKRGKAGVGLYPLLATLGIFIGVTPALQAEVARQVTESTSFDVAQANLNARGIDLDRKTTRRIAYGLADRALDYRDAMLEGRVSIPDEQMLNGKRVVVCTDGGRYRQRVPAKAGRKRTKTRRRRFKAQWREPKAFVIYIIDDKGQKMRNALSPLADATTGNADKTFELLVGYLRAYGAKDAKEIVFASDGAHWIWDRIPALVSQLGIDPARVHEVIDFYHALEHLTTAADLRSNWTKCERKKWLKCQRRRLKAGKIELVIAAIDELCVGRKAKQFARERDYFISNSERMRYAEFRSLAIPCGSGAIESAIRRIVNLRLKGNGIFWREENAERVLHMRANLKVGRWREMVINSLHLLPLNQRHA